jgi:hypothetical protein
LVSGLFTIAEFTTENEMESIANIYISPHNYIGISGEKLKDKVVFWLNKISTTP